MPSTVRNLPRRLAWVVSLHRLLPSRLLRRSSEAVKPRNDTHRAEHSRPVLLNGPLIFLDDAGAPSVKLNLNFAVATSASVYSHTDRILTV